MVNNCFSHDSPRGLVGKLKYPNVHRKFIYRFLSNQDLSIWEKNCPKGLDLVLFFLLFYFIFFLTFVFSLFSLYTEFFYFFFHCHFSLLIKERPLQLFTQLKQLRLEKTLRLRNRIPTHDFYDASAVLYQLNYSRQLGAGHIVNS